MSRRLVICAALLLITACNGGESTPATTSTAPKPTTTAPSADTMAPSTSEPIDDRPVWKGFAATSASESTLAAMLHDDLTVFAEPGDAAPEWTIDATTILGTVTVLGVVSGPSDGWVELMLPVRPNGSTGWARSDELSFYFVDSEIVVDLGERRLSYSVDGVEILATEVGIGSVHNQTPVGEYFVTDSVTLSDPKSPWGPHALGISARSETITEYNGGDGIIGIHGTNNPSSIGGNISLGCVRLPNDMITALHAMVPIGTRVIVNA